MNDASWLLYPGLFVVSLVGAAAGAYFKRRAENLATHDDLDKLVAQMSAVTATTENIKAAISDDVWDRQRQWEMKRDSIFDFIRALGELDNALFELNFAYSQSIPDEDDLKTRVLGKRKEKREAFDLCNSKIDGARFLTDVIVGRNFAKAIFECVNEMRSIATKVLGGDADYYMGAQLSLAEKISAVNVAARNELNLKTQGDVQMK
jgi:hypothetical protein